MRLCKDLQLRSASRSHDQNLPTRSNFFRQKQASHLLKVPISRNEPFRIARIVANARSPTIRHIRGI